MNKLVVRIIDIWYVLLDPNEEINTNLFIGELSGLTLSDINKASTGYGFDEAQLAKIKALIRK